MSLQATTWQTVGPYFSIGLTHLNTDGIAAPDEPGEHIAVEGRVVDAHGQPVPDAVIETWQANAAGEYPGARASTSFGFCRIPTDAEGRFRFTTIRPGPVPGPNGTLQAPHLAVRVMMRGLLKDLVTRIYFPADDHASDPVLALVPEARRPTLIATPSTEKQATFDWTIKLQGDSETVFFDC